MKLQRFHSIREAIEGGTAGAQRLKLRSELMLALKDHLASTARSEAQAAALFAVPQARIAELMSGRIQRFDLESLVNMAAAAGLRIEIRVRGMAGG